MSPVIEHVRIGGAWVGAGGESPEPPEEFILGVTKPTEENSGPRIAPTATYGSPGNPYHLTITTPGVYSGLEVWGRITIEPPTGVELWDSQVHMTGNPTTDQNAIVIADQNAYGHVVAHCHIDVPDEVERQNERFAVGVRGGGVLVTRSIIEHVVDAVNGITLNTGAANRKMQVHGNVLRDLVDRPSLFQPDGIAHCDGVQGMGGVELEVIGNTIYGGSTSCVILTQSSSPARQGYSDVTVEDNWFYGHPTQGATINVTSTGGLAIPSLKVHRNRVDPSGNLAGQIRVSAPNRVPASFGAVSGTTNGTLADWVFGPDANVYMDTGLPVTLRQG